MVLSFGHHICNITSQVTRAFARLILIFQIYFIFYLIIIYKFKSFSSHVICFSNQECFSAASALVPPFAYIFLYQ